MTGTPRRAGIRERLSYRFDRFMERGTVALIAGPAVISVDRAIPVGIVRDGGARLAPPPGELIRPDDRLVLLAEDQGSARVADAPAAMDERQVRAAAPRSATLERILVLGWNRRGTAIIRELDHYVAPGSEVVAVSRAQSAA